MTETAQQAEPARVIGVTGVALTSFNCVVGIGIFGLPGLVAGILGPAAIVAYLACLVLVALIGLCLAEAGSRVPHPGGLYAYATAAFGPVLGGVTGALALFASSVGSAAALARFFIDTLAGFIPAAASPVGVITVLLLLYGVLAITNTLGARDGGRLAVLFGVLKFAPLLLLIVVGAFAIKPENLVWTTAPPPAQVGQAALLLFFAFMGIESGLYISGETRNPARTIPRAIALARAGQLPRFLGRLHPRFGTPVVAIWLYSAVVILVALSGTFQQIAVLAVAGTLAAYLMCCLGVLRLRSQGLAGDGAPFVAPGGWFAPVAAAVMIIWLLTTLAPRELTATLGFVIVVGGIYAARHAIRRRAAPAG